MGEQLLANKLAILEMDKVHRDPGEAWGANKLSFLDWDNIEQASACLYEAAQASQLLEGERYCTSSLIIPTVFRLMAYSSANAQIYFENRERDALNDPDLNPVMMSPCELAAEVELALKMYHDQLVSRFDANLSLKIKQFWYICTLLDPRFKKLKFDGDRMLTDARRREAVAWLQLAFVKDFKGKFVFSQTPPACGASDSLPTTSCAESDEAAIAEAKRRKVSSAGFFRKRGPDAPISVELDPNAPVDLRPKPHRDEMKAYLALPQVPHDDEWVPLRWWKEQSGAFPELSIMARQYLGCPASSASVERLFSVVGTAFSTKRKNSSAETIAMIAFAKLNVT
jgi:hypothetical protein